MGEKISRVYFGLYKRALGESFLTEEYALRVLDTFLVQNKCMISKRSPQN